MTEKQQKEKERNRTNDRQEVSTFGTIKYGSS